MPMMAITTSNSTSVKPRERLLQHISASKEKSQEQQTPTPAENRGGVLLGEAWLAVGWLVRGENLRQGGAGRVAPPYCVATENQSQFAPFYHEFLRRQEPGANLNRYINRGRGLPSRNTLAWIQRFRRFR
jgi:hypothetical protein